MIPCEGLVGVDADREDALLQGGVERPQAAEAGDLEHDVGALRDVVERDLLAQRLVDEVVRVVVQQRDVGVRVLRALLVAGDPVVDRRDRDAADVEIVPLSVIIAATIPAR